MVKICILDDHELFRVGIKEMLKKEDNFNMVAEYSNISTLNENIINDQPDILLLDITVDNTMTFNAIKSIKLKMPDIKIIMLTMHKKEFYVMRAIDEKVDGYINKDVKYDELINGLIKVQKGERFFSSEISDLLVNNIYSNSPGKKIGIKDLTDREKEILGNILTGKSSTEIAESLNISKKTVDNHRANILKKYGFSNTTMLIKELIDNDQV